VLFSIALPLALYFSPPDYQQKEAVRIMYVHVPAAFLSLFLYVVMAGFSALYYVWHIKVASHIAFICAKLGSYLTLLALITGSLWGKPMWGTFWVWDARLTSELVLFFLYVGYLALRQAIPEPKQAAKLSSLLALVGVVNVPVVHFSVYWWYTLHQGPSLGSLQGGHLAPAMLAPLLLMLTAFFMVTLAAVLSQLRLTLLIEESHTTWALSPLKELA